MDYSTDFWEIRGLLPKDERGDPDWVFAQKAMEAAYGVNNIRAMTPLQIVEFKSSLRSQ